MEPDNEQKVYTEKITDYGDLVEYLNTVIDALSLHNLDDPIDPDDTEIVGLYDELSELI